MQYAYLERLMKVCLDEKHPSGPSQKLIRGKDKVFNADLSHTRQKVQDLIKMADEARAVNAAQDDAGPVESKPYD